MDAELLEKMLAERPEMLEWCCIEECLGDPQYDVSDMD